MTESQSLKGPKVPEAFREPEARPDDGVPVVPEEVSFDPEDFRARWWPADENSPCVERPEV